MTTRPIKVPERHRADRVGGLEKSSTQVCSFFDLASRVVEGIALGLYQC
jgi:hypothetical protein